MKPANTRGLASLVSMVVRPEYSSLLILVVMVAIAAALQRNFFQGPSLLLTIDAFGPLILLTMGQAVVMVTGLFRPLLRRRPLPLHMHPHVCDED